jgi:hypothetical protein
MTTAGAGPAVLAAAAAAAAAVHAADWPDGLAQLHQCLLAPAPLARAQMLLRLLLQMPAWTNLAVAAFLQAAGLCALYHHCCLLAVKTAGGVGAAPQPG